MRSRRKAIIVAAVVLFALLFAGVGVLLVRGFMAFSRAEASLNDTKGRLEFLYGRNPFPSDQNLERERANLDVIEKEISSLLGALSRGQVEPLEQSPAKFVGQFWEAREAMLVKAEAAGVTVLGKKEFDFSFGRQMTGGLPTQKDVARLTQQLRIVQSLFDVLCTSRIAELRGIGREEFEEEATGAGAARAAAVPPSGHHKGAGGASGPAMNTVDAEAGLVPEGKMFGTWHFSFDFAANESALIRVLDGFARNPLFTVVTRVELVGDSKMNAKAPEAAPAPSAGLKGAAAKRAARGATAPAKPVPAAALSSDLRIVCGRDTPVSVRMEVDVYQFAKPAASPARAEGAP